MTFKISTPEGKLVYGHATLDTLDRAVATARRIRLFGEPLEVRYEGQIVAEIDEHGKLTVRDSSQRFEGTAPWTPADNDIAYGEGWGLFNVETNPEIQRDDELDVFAGDEEALVYVISWARAGSLVHARALQLHFGVVQWEDPDA